MKRFASMVFVGLVMFLGIGLVGCGDDDGGSDIPIIPGSTAVTGITLNKSSTTIGLGSTEQLTATVEPSDAADKSVSWSSDNEGVATVASDGTVTAIAVGTATITVTTTDGGFTDECEVTTVIIDVTGVSLNKSSTSIPVGSTEQLTATVEPSDAADKSVSWSSDNEGVATVASDGTVTAIAVGTATITVETTYGGFTADCEVTVIIPVTGVTLNKGSTTINVGSTEQLTATVEPSDATDKSVSWSSDNEGVATVASDGTVTAIAAGTATITVSTTDGGFTDTCEVTVPHRAGDSETLSAGGVSFNLVYVEGKSFPTVTNDSGTAEVGDSYWIGETELTYELWDAVHTWATTNGYSFANAGIMGDGTGDTAQHPVTMINWRDSMVWCNALTEYYNEQNGTGFTPVYTDDDTLSGTPIRDSRDSNWAQCDAVVPVDNATGFRLLTSNEWELAARYISDFNGDGDIEDSGEFYPGDFASGADADYDDIALSDYDGDGDQDETGDVAWYWDNSGSSTHEVGDKDDNALGIYDMSGNVWEWCFDLSGSDRVGRGGSWLYSAGYMQVGRWGSNVPYYENIIGGFRFARTP
ncbi:MAG: Ig-like domain-containing protein [Spirochaetota bacterium]|nr:Ig-like domain-containing protein [Spirochaetota bacterium]